MTIDDAGSSFEIKDLPELAAGQKYTLTYEVEITNKSTDGSGKFYNTAWVQEDDKHETPATHSKYIENLRSTIPKMVTSTGLLPSTTRTAAT